MSGQDVSSEHNWSRSSVRDYLDANYSFIDPETDFLCQLYLEFLSQIPNGKEVLELGGGPSIFSLIPMRQKYEQIFFADYNEGNLSEIKLWLADDPISFNWDPFFELFAYHEKGSQSLAAMKDELRGHITKLTTCDVHSKTTIPALPHKLFDLVSTNYCPESITADYDLYHASLDNIVGLIKPGGHLIMNLLKECRHWTVKGEKMSCVWVDEVMIDNLLAERGVRVLTMKTFCAKDHERKADSGEFTREAADGTNYSGLIGLLGVKDF
jgi:hypothetical protein